MIELIDIFFNQYLSIFVGIVLIGLILFIFAVLALMSSPGPSQILMLSNSVTYGFKRASATICGDLSANMLQMLAAILGLSFLIISSSNIFNFIKWIGVAYLVWNALNMFFRKNNLKKVKKINSNKIFKKLYLQGFITSASNPKAIIFFASLFPQFIVIDQNIWIQFIILSLTYVTIDGIFLTTYGLGASYIVSFIKNNSAIWVNRIGGVLMLITAILLGFKSIKDN